MANNKNQQSHSELLYMTTDIVSAYVSGNPMNAEMLPDAINAVFGTLARIDSAGGTPTNLNPAVPVDKSVTPNHIICLEDGKKLTMLKRYLRTRFQLSPEEYRIKWGLPFNYPMVAPNYSRKRSEFAKKSGLGRKSVKPAKQAKRRS